MPEDIETTSKISHQEFGKSNFAFRVNNGDVTEVIQNSYPYYVVMIGLTNFIYEEEGEEYYISIQVKLKYEVVENSKTYEVVDKTMFTQWDDGVKISFEKQLEIMKNFKKCMLGKLGVEIVYE